MEILIVVATESEIAAFREYLRAHWIASSHDRYTRGECTVEILVTGVGMHRTAFALGRRLTHTLPDLCINAGIAGAFPGKAEIGAVVHVISEVIGDLGAEDRDGNFLSMDDLGLEEDLSSSGGLVNTSAGQFQFLPTARGLTVQTAHGSNMSISIAIARWDADVETMEGGAFFYCCLKTGVPFLEIRAVSNIVAPRDRESWNIPLALHNLHRQLLEIITFFAGQN